MCSAFRLGNPGVRLPGLGTGFASYIVREMKITSFLDLLVLKVDNLFMQFHLNVMTCHLCTSLPPDSCSGAENHNGFFWISIRQIYTYHRVNLFNCAEDLSVQLVFSI